MKQSERNVMQKLGRHVAQLGLRKHQLEHRILKESNRPLPCSITLRRLKIERLKLKDRLAELRHLLGRKGAQIA